MVRPVPRGGHKYPAGPQCHRPTAPGRTDSAASPDAGGTENQRVADLPAGECRQPETGPSRPATPLRGEKMRKRSIPRTVDDGYLQGGPVGGRGGPSRAPLCPPERVSGCPRPLFPYQCARGALTGRLVRQQAAYQHRRLRPGDELALALRLPHRRTAQPGETGSRAAVHGAACPSPAGSTTSKLTFQIWPSPVN